MLKRIVALAMSLFLGVHVVYADVNPPHRDAPRGGNAPQQRMPASRLAAPGEAKSPRAPVAKRSDADGPPRYLSREEHRQLRESIDQADRNIYRREQRGR
jgi:hypothetical protein